MPSPRVAVVDIGSNSIKVLVAERGPDGRIVALLSKTLDARISAGISQAKPRLSAESMARGIDAIQQLILSALPFAPDRMLLVATSAVRDAENGTAFRESVRAATGHDVRILGGKEEADLIGRGLTCDPALAGLSDFYVFDLGGGSLECLAYRERQVETARSLQLGCVRLTESLVPDASAAIDSSTVRAIQAHTRAELLASEFRFTLPIGSVAVGTGGTITTVRAILAARDGLPLEKTSTRVELERFRTLLQELSGLPLSGRKQIAGLPSGRADVFPAALATLVAVAEAGGFDAYQHSFYNLRFGLAAEALDRLAAR
jgi:exopolyphosphatase/guanosine-5'-triphosphate,3'-diphosphate pyrophosphatase